MMHHTLGLCDDMWWPLSWSFLVLIAFSSLVLGLSAQMHIHVLFSSEQASCQLSRHSCLFHQPLIKLEHCGTCSRPISHLHPGIFCQILFHFLEQLHGPQNMRNLTNVYFGKRTFTYSFPGSAAGAAALNNPPYFWPNRFLKNLRYSTEMFPIVL